MEACLLLFAPTRLAKLVFYQCHDFVVQIIIFHSLGCHCIDTVLGFPQEFLMSKGVGVAFFGFFGSQSPQLPPRRGTPPDDPQPNIVKRSLSIKTFHCRELF